MRSVTSDRPPQNTYDWRVALGEIVMNTVPGERLPSEPKLAEQLGISRATLREAMVNYEEQGIIQRKQGIGTFVISHAPVFDSGLEILESIETLAKRIQLDVAMGDLVVEQIWAGKEESEGLGVRLKTPLIRVNRTIHVKNRPVAFLVDVLPEDILKSSDLENGFTGSVLDLLLKRSDLSLAHSSTDVGAVPAPKEIASRLKIKAGDALLRLSARLIAADSRTIDYSKSFFLPGYFRFHVVRRVSTQHGISLQLITEKKT